MRIGYFTHSLVSDWNHGNAHFLRGVVTELLDRAHSVRVLEPRDGWSRRNLVAQYGTAPLDAFRASFPHLRSALHDPATIDLPAVLAGHTAAHRALELEQHVAGVAAGEGAAAGQRRRPRAGAARTGADGP